MNNYFQIRRSSDPKVIGVRDGSSQAKIDRAGFQSKEKYDEFYNYFFNRKVNPFWEIFGRIPNFEVDLECVKLNRKAKLTDFLSYYPEIFGGNYLVNNKIIKILNAFNLPNIKLFNVKLVDDDRIRTDYKLLFAQVLDYDVIDFKKTIFFKGSSITGKYFFEINDKNEFEKLKDNSSFQVEKLVLNDNFLGGLDFFLTKVTDPQIFVSERLKKALEDANVTGVNIVKAIEPEIISPQSF
jgi:hypothetical protein